MRIRWIQYFFRPYRRQVSSKTIPIIDGNKRKGFVLGALFLELNGYRFTATQEDVAKAVLALAAGQMDELDYAAFLTVRL